MGVSGSVAAVVITFNRKKLLLECLNALKNQTRPPDAIFIIDGPSTDGTPEALLKESCITELPPKEYDQYLWETISFIESSKIGKRIKIYYTRLYEDVGGAGGFHEGVKRAYMEDYDWVWLMDDDAEPKEDALEKLIKYINLPNVVGLACLKIDEKDVLHYHRGYFHFENVFKYIVRPIKESDYEDKPFVEIDHASFVGILVKSDAIRKIGLPDKRFFITYDDVEYCIRLRAIGKIYLIPESIIVHKERFRKASLIKKKFRERVIYRIPYEKFWKTYYGVRNLTYLGKLYSKNKLKFILDMLRSWVRYIGGILLLDDHKFERIMLITSAYIDGLRGVFDNEKPKRILYGERG